MTGKVSNGGAVKLLLAAFIVCLTLVAPTQASNHDPNGGFGPYDRPVFLIISLTDAFDVSAVDKVNGSLKHGCLDMGSQTLFLEVGRYVGGQELADTRYEGIDLNSIDLSGLPVNPEDLDLNQVTVVGSAKTFGESVHMFTPTPNPILPQVQQAFFNASPFLTGVLSEFPTTIEIAWCVYDFQDGAGADFNDILEALFDTDMLLGCTTCSAVGDIYPHQPQPEPLFNFDVSLDTDNGAFELNICIPVDFDIKPGSSTNPLNLGSEGVLPVALLTGGGNNYDAPAETDGTMVVAVFTDAFGNETLVPGVKNAVEDVDGDGDDDIIFHFDTQELVDAGADEYTLFLDFQGFTLNGMCIEGRDNITIVPPNK
ncbi:MAG: hypothetical protein ACYS99_14810 [Planctomycetota bacterium]|jgi:hypothetical protein